MLPANVIQYYFEMPSPHPEALFVIDLLKGRQGIIIDIGCGTNKTVPNAVGVDVRSVTDVTCSGDSTPFVNDHADIIISRHSFEHLLNPVATLREWYRILKPDGEILFVLPDHEHLNTMCALCSAEQHMHAYTRQSFKDLIEMSGLFKVEYISSVIHGWSSGGVLRKITGSSEN